MNLAPIVLFVYNRPDHLRLTIEALRNNYLANGSQLFVFSDGPRNEADRKLVFDVRKYVKTIKGFRKVEVVERVTNYGLANSIISGVTDIVNKYGKIIVLEDDLVTSPYFLKYMNDALNYYETTMDVMCISGYIYPIRNQLPNTFFIKGADNLGWGTWKRGWSLFEEDGYKLLQSIKQKRLRRKFTRNFSYPYYKMLKDQIKSKNNSWAIRWYASALIQKKLTLYPHKSLVKHIGSDGSGSNVKVVSDVLGTETHNESIEIDSIGVAENKTALKHFEKYLRSMMVKLLCKFISSKIISPFR